MKVREFLTLCAAGTNNKDREKLDVLIAMQDGTLFTVDSVTFEEDENGDYLCITMDAEVEG